MEFKLVVAGETYRLLSSFFSSPLFEVDVFEVAEQLDKVLLLISDQIPLIERRNKLCLRSRNPKKLSRLILHF